MIQLFNTQTIPWLGRRWTEGLRRDPGSQGNVKFNYLFKVAEHCVYSLPWSDQFLKELCISTCINRCYFFPNNQLSLPAIQKEKKYICFCKLSHHRCPSWVLNHGMGMNFLLGSMGSSAFVEEEPQHIFFPCHSTNMACYPYIKASACLQHILSCALNVW